jgi:hypothetical protein
MDAREEVEEEEEEQEGHKAQERKGEVILLSRDRMNLLASFWLHSFQRQFHSHIFFDSLITSERYIFLTPQIDWILPSLVRLAVLYCVLDTFANDSLSPKLKSLALSRLLCPRWLSPD